MEPAVARTLSDRSGRAVALHRQSAIATVRAYIGLGSNQGDSASHLRDAVAELARSPGVAVVAQSGHYRSAPLGYLDQADFLNAVVAIDTALSPAPLLAVMQSIENRHGRARSFPNAPRTLDLDMLLYGSQTINEPDLVVPHPRLTERAFVLAPLHEIAPELRLPDGQGLQAALAAVAAQRVVLLDD
jgi:2-amino-4-hydroxy-6-hydroxymethyldihydropteridine diphosphokinase